MGFIYYEAGDVEDSDNEFNSDKKINGADL